MRVLIVRDDNIGDGVLFSGALSSLRRLYPGSHITLVVRRHASELFRHCPYLDRVTSYERLAPWEQWQARRVRGAWALEGLARSIARRRMGRFDAILCPVSAPRQELISLVDSLRGDEKIGFAGYMLQYPEGRLPDIDPADVFTKAVHCRREERWQHEFLRLQAWLQLCGCREAVAPQPELWLTDHDYELAESALPPEEEYIGAFLGASSHWRRWPVASWCELLASVGAGRTVTLFGGPDASEDAREIDMILKHAGQRVCNLCGGTALRQLAACIQRCDFVVSTESAGLHMAIAQDVPTVGIVGQHHMGRYVPWGDPSRHRIASIPCDRSDDCTGACYYEDYRCIQEIPVEVVRREIDALREVIG
jgi:ADP-heptose:LPS heptosyltransferase